MPPIDTVTEVEQPDVVERHAQAGQPQAAAEAAGAGDHRLPRADALDPPAEDRGREPEHDQGDRVDPADLGDGPVPPVDRLGDANDARQRHVEDAEAVDLADAQVDGQRGGRNQPAVESGRGDRALPIENRVERHGHSAGPCNDRLLPVSATGWCERSDDVTTSKRVIRLPERRTDTQATPRNRWRHVTSPAQGFGLPLTGCRAPAPDRNRPRSFT